MSSYYLRAITHFLPFLGLLSLTYVAKPIRVDSPNGAVQVTVDVTNQGQPTYAVRYRSAEVPPPRWAAVRFLEGYPAQYTVLARQVLVLGLYQRLARPVSGSTVSVTLPAHGGFVVQPYSAK